MGDGWATVTALLPREGTELSERAMAAAPESRQTAAPLVEPGWFAECASVWKPAKLVGGNRYSVFWRRGRKKERVRKIILHYSLELDFLRYSKHYSDIKEDLKEEMKTLP